MPASQVSSQRPIARDEARTPVVVSHRAFDADRASRGKAAARPVTHSYAALAFFTEGEWLMEQNGRWQASAGDVLLVPAGQPHRMLEPHPAPFWGLSFCVPCVTAAEATSLLAPFERVRDGASAVVRIPSERHAFLESLLRELQAVVSDARPPAAQPAVQQSLLTLILNEVERAACAIAQPTAARSSVVVDSLRYIERNCLRPLSLSEVAAAVGRSPAYVTSAVSRATGRSAVAWIVSGRMSEARRLLLHSDERVELIAQRVGYADATHFIRMFRREHAATPAAWRAAHSGARP